MEKRTLLAVVLMAAFFILYQMLFLPAPAPKPAPDQQASKPAPGSTPSPAPDPAAPAPASAPAPLPLARAEAATRDAPPPALVTVESPLYRTVVSSEGGKLQEVVLRYRGDKPLVITGEQGPAGLVVTTNGGGPVPMRFARDAPIKLDAGDPKGTVVLEGAEAGLRIRHTLEFTADAYTIDVRTRVENPGPEARAVRVALPWSTRQAWHEARERFPGQHPIEVVLRDAGGTVQHRYDLCTSEPLATDGAWIGVGSTWYLAALLPKTPGFRMVASGEPKGCEGKGPDPVGRLTIAVQATPTIAPGQAWEGHVVMYVGPKEYDRLKAHGLEGSLDFGGFPVPRAYGGLPMEWIGVPILLLMNWVYKYVGNYGIAIILLTVISKVLFYPLTVKSMRSMKAMQALQPQMNALRSKHKKDPQELQRATMELYRKHKVNPLGGCLPMLAQIPVFYALYLALSVSVELQNAAFLCFGRLFGVDLWICDLASQDPTYVLPILMGVTMFIQQKMTPVMGDPRQAKMMLFMPVVFTFMFLSLPSGLVLYWTVSNVLQIAQQRYMDRPGRAAAQREAKDASRA
jgi:YidC/Oxa1 family membrane protein insertase